MSASHATGGNAVVVAHGLGLSAGPVLLLRDVHLSIGAGERVALIGHNGAGKTTLLRALAGFGMVRQGCLHVLDVALEAGPTRATLRQMRGRVAPVHQGLQLVARLSVIDNVLIGGAARFTSPWSWLGRWPVPERRQALAALGRVGMAWAAGRRTDSLSGGERQKVAIARALHQQAPILLADEPTASLDMHAAEEVADLLAAVARERGATLISVVHDLDLLHRLADRVVVLRAGRVIADVPVTAHSARELKGLLK